MVLAVQNAVDYCKKNRGPHPSDRDVAAFWADPKVVGTFEELPLLGESVIYLAGPTNFSQSVTYWRIQMWKQLRALGYKGWIITPQLEGRKPAKGEGDRIVEWEDHAMKRADVIVFACVWAEYGEGAPGTGDTTKDELGDWRHLAPQKLVVWYPATTRKSAWRRRHVINDPRLKIMQTEESAIQTALQMIAR